MEYHWFSLFGSHVVVDAWCFEGFTSFEGLEEKQFKGARLIATSAEAQKELADRFDDICLVSCKTEDSFQHATDEAFLDARGVC